MTVNSASRRNANNRVKGAAFERKIRDTFRSYGFDAERTRNTGTKDEGDVVVRDRGEFFVVESKNTKNLTKALQGYLQEAVVEAGHFSESHMVPFCNVYPVVIHKTPGKSAVEEGVVLMRASDLIRLMKRDAR